jgi:E3 ubiquitin-protein ligase RFWD2
MSSRLQQQLDRMDELWDDLIVVYEEKMRVASDSDAGERRADLLEFGRTLQSTTQYTTCHSLATVNYAGVQAQQAMAIVSSIEFDRDQELFCVAGVTKKIKVYNYADVLERAHALASQQHPPQATALMHAPAGEMECLNKISCISWNSYTRSLLASSDYEGVVQLWDPCAQRSLQKYEVGACAINADSMCVQEHEKRCWTVHFSQVQPHCFASGSDDGHVKLWSVNAARSIADIDVGVNICCVHFAPTDGNYLVLGSADHNVHRYDLRNTLHPVNIFVAHSKAVSYVKYMDDAHIISA